MTTEIYAYRLLVWLADHTGRDTYQVVNIVEFAAVENLPVAQEERAARLLEGAAQLLEARGYVTLYVASGPTIDARLTAEGVSEAERIVAERADPVARLDHALGGLVKTAYADPADGLRLGLFVATAMFLGEHLKIDEVLRAARYLHDHGLAVIGSGAGGQPETLTLTSRGIDCALAGTKVRKFVSDQNTSATGPTFNQYISAGGAGAQGMSVTQNVGVQPAQLADLVRQLRDVAPRLELAQPARDEFLQDVEVLEDSDQDPQERLSAGQRIKAALIQGGTAVGVEAILAGLTNIAGMISG
ncbi:hypothetical protein OG352_13470 [Streptomyces sp. NBC_01485]|uniref:hypothetical protein n=1 Tax=Streptomyces sp. NBC_01485 TaxID=2903884 RepID=UPI002E36D2A6|nr:hypothetical protein [Streptomyces sp. NBC_01485]